MKKNDIAAIILIAAFSAIISYFIANTLIGKPQNDPVEVEQVTSIQGSFPAPDSRIFNDNSIDPTVEIKGGSKANETPFTN